MKLPRLNINWQLWLPVFVFLGFSLEALARAGGGGGFSGGGSRGGGGSFSGSGSGDGLGALIYLAFRYPLVGVPVLCVVGYVMYKGGQNANSRYQGHVIHNYNKSQKLAHKKEGLEAIQQRDANFDPEGFRKRVNRFFTKIQQAWSEGELAGIRPYVSDAVYTRFALIYEMYGQSGIRNVMQNLRIHTINIQSVSSNDTFDTIGVAIEASAVDYFIDTNSGKRVYGSTDTVSFCEVWSFVRKRGAKPLTGEGLMEGFCPNCGTPLQINESVSCTTCQALITSGVYDWVLTEITQFENWTAHNRNVPNLPKLLYQDPLFSTQTLEDRTSTAFWQYIRAGFFAAPGQLPAFVTPEFNAKRQFRPNLDGTRTFYADAAVASVELIGLELDQNGFDEAYLRIVWSAHEETASLKSPVIPAFEKSQRRADMVLMKRRSGAVTSEAQQLHSMHCRGCGAPATLDNRGACTYCGAVFADGNDWLLDAIGVDLPSHFFKQIYDTHGQPREADSTPSHEFGILCGDREVLMQSLIGMMLADGQVDAKERETLYKFAKRFNYTSGTVDAMIRQVESNGAQFADDLSDHKKAARYLEALLEMAMADGRVDRSEMQFIQQAAKPYGYGENDIKMMAGRVRRRLYQEAQKARKLARAS